MKQKISQNYCPNCGSELKANKSFCPKCGKKRKINEKSPGWTKKFKKPLLWVVLVISALGFIGKLIDVIWFISDPSSPLLSYSTINLSIIGVAIFGSLGIFCIIMLGIFDSLSSTKVGKIIKIILTILGCIFLIILFLTWMFIRGERIGM